MSIFNVSFQPLWYLKKEAPLKYFAKLKEKKPVPVTLFIQSSEAYSEPFQTSRVKRFAKIADGWQPGNAQS